MSGVKILLNFVSFKLSMNSLCTCCSVLYAFIHCIGCWVPLSVCLSVCWWCPSSTSPLGISSWIVILSPSMELNKFANLHSIFLDATRPTLNPSMLTYRILAPSPLCVNNVHHPLQISPILSRAGHMYVLYVSSNKKLRPTPNRWEAALLSCLS